MHFKVKNIKGHKYLYLIKNDRIDGKVVQTIQKYVGTADSLYEMLTSNKPFRIASYIVILLTFYTKNLFTQDFEYPSFL